MDSPAGWDRAVATVGAPSRYRELTRQDGARPSARFRWSLAPGLATRTHDRGDCPLRRAHHQGRRPIWTVAMLSTTSRQPSGRAHVHAFSQPPAGPTRAAVAVPIGTACCSSDSRYADDGRSSAQRVVTKYFGILNAGMTSADGDFSALATVYPQDARLTQSNPAGVTNVPRPGRHHGVLRGSLAGLPGHSMRSQDNIRTSQST